MIVKQREVMGAEVLDIDLAGDVQRESTDALRSLYAEHGLLFFRDQHISQEKHIEIARWFGDINVNRFFPQVPNQPMIAEVRKNPDDKFNIGERWHTDHSVCCIKTIGSRLNETLG